MLPWKYGNLNSRGERDLRDLEGEIGKPKVKPKSLSISGGTTEKITKELNSASATRDPVNMN